jgi:hypothetical protein
MNGNFVTMMSRFWFVLLWLLLSTKSHSIPIFKIEFLLGTTNFSSTLGLYDPPEERFLRITNQSHVNMTGILYRISNEFVIDEANTTCGYSLAPNSSCTLALFFTPNQLGRFVSQLNVCGVYGAWCSNFPTVFDITVAQHTIVSTDCSTIENRPFSALNCQGSYAYANNFKTFIEKVLHTQAGINSQFNYFQHLPSQNETTTPCSEARQDGVNLDPNIAGGGGPLCSLMSFATSNAEVTNNPALSKLFPPYLNFLLATAYPIIPNTVPLSELNPLRNQFNTSTMDASVRDLGYLGHLNFLGSYYLEQLQKTYTNCGTTEICPAIYYLPYTLTSNQSSLESWPPNINYWGSSGGGGSGAGYQIQAFMPGSNTHYTLFSGGGGGGGGNTTPEGASMIDLINTGSGGGGGSQFSDCYVTGSDHLNGLGLGAGTGSGFGIAQNSNVTFPIAPSVDYTYYPPISHSNWNDGTVLTEYVANLTYLFQTLIPRLYNEGYTITLTGGGGGGAGLEFLNTQGQEFQPHPVSIGYGFRFCYVFNKNNTYEQSDCLSSSSVSTDLSTAGIDLDTLIYQNVGNFYHEGIEMAILPQNCNGYNNFQCTCAFQHAYVICQLDKLLLANHYSTADIPNWLIHPHCNDSQELLSTTAEIIDHYQLGSNTNIASCQTSVENYFQSKSSTNCAVPWGTING